MGREIRRVPPNWEHPRVVRFGEPTNQLQPMFDVAYEDAAREWLKECLDWHVNKNYPDYADEEARKLYFWDWSGMPPEEEYYRPWKTEEATWFQLWETVTEGTPVSPPFATKQELADYLAKHGDYWDQKSGRGGWGYENADAFMQAEWAPTLVMTGGKVFDGARQAGEIPSEIKKGADPHA